MATKTMTKSETVAARERIAEIEAMDAECVGTDAGTHVRPAIHCVYETITGERYATRSFAGADATRCTEAEAGARTDGRIRVLAGNQDRIRAMRSELAELRRAVR